MAGVAYSSNWTIEGPVTMLFRLESTQPTTRLKQRHWSQQPASLPTTWRPFTLRWSSSPMLCHPSSPNPQKQGPQRPCCRSPCPAAIHWEDSHPMDTLALQHPRQQGGWQASEGRGETATTAWLSYHTKPVLSCLSAGLSFVQVTVDAG